jgi:hypothetical protein
MDGGMAIYSGEKANKANKTRNQYSLDLKSDSTYVFRYSVSGFGSDVMFILVLKSGTWSIKEDVLILANAPAQFFEYPEIPFAIPLSTDFKRTMSNQIEFRIAKEGEYVTPISARLIPLKLSTSGIIRNIILERIHKNKKMQTN